jgi:hypothetical protein
VLIMPRQCCRSFVAISFPVLASHNRILLSYGDAVAKRAPSGEYAVLAPVLAPSLRARRVLSFFPVVASHSRTVPSSHPVMIRLPSGENVALRTLLSLPCGTAISRPIAASQIRTALSDLVMIWTPSEEKATPVTSPASWSLGEVTPSFVVASPRGEVARARETLAKYRAVFI